MLIDTLKNIEKLYSNNLDNLGKSSQSVGWPNAKDHWLRFEMLFKSINLKDIASLNDLGCGYGSVLNFLYDNSYYLKDYYGYDISEKMLNNFDESKYKKTNISKIIDSSLTNAADFTIASGIFNVKFAEDDMTWKNHIVATLHNMNDFSNKGFSFNLLSTYVDFKKDNLYYGDPLFFFDYCKKNFSRYVSIYHDYPLWEWTIVVKK